MILEYENVASKTVEILLTSNPKEYSHTANNVLGIWITLKTFDPLGQKLTNLGFCCLLLSLF